MKAFAQKLIAFLAANNVLPSEVTAADTNREKTYLQSLPETPDKAYCLRIYDTALPSLVDKQAGVHYVQITMRNKNHAQVLADITALWKFLINRPEFIEYIDATTWVIFDVTSGPIGPMRDEKGNYLYTLNFPVKTQMF